MKEVLYTTAIDKNGILIHIDHAQKGLNYYCPLCKREFILRKSGKTGKGSKRPHFAHNEITPNCTPEGVLHYSFKKMLIELLERKKEANTTLDINWNCDTCFHKNSGNILENVTSIKEEYVLDVCRPDIALLDKDENVFAVIEIVVTHKPEERVVQYYIEKKIVLIHITISSEEDLNKVEEKITHPDFVDFCYNHKCQNKDRYKIIREIKFKYGVCGLSIHRIEKYFILIDSVFGKKESQDFTENEIDLVKSHRQNIEIKTNPTTNEKYPVNICLVCKRYRMRYSPRRF